MKKINMFKISILILKVCFISAKICRSINKDLFHIYAKDNLKIGLEDYIDDLKDYVTSIIEKVERVENKIANNDNLLKPKHCAEVQEMGFNISGVYTIYPISCGDYVDVYCDLSTDSGGWLVIQKRISGEENFWRDWNDYKFGFGNPSLEYWLGNNYISFLTNLEKHEMRIDMEDFEGETKFAQYKKFSISSETFKYKLSIGGYLGTAGDSMDSANNMAFSTKDRDNDVWSDNCAIKFKGAWWYKDCHMSNLNGQYLRGNHSTYADGVNWFTFKGSHYSLKHVEMKIRPLSFQNRNIV